MGELGYEKGRNLVHVSAGGEASSPLYVFLNWSRSSRFRLPRGGQNSGVEERNVFLDGLASDMQLVGREVWVGIPDRETTHDRELRRAIALPSDHLARAR